jgi:hypothetical protein
LTFEIPPRRALGGYDGEHSVVEFVGEGGESAFNTFKTFASFKTAVATACPRPCRQNSENVIINLTFGTRLRV